MVSEQSRRVSRVSINAICGLLAFVLFLSAMAHLRNPYEFLGVVHSYKLLPRIVAEWIATIIPSLELSVAVAILSFQNQRSLGLFICIGLFSIYSLAQSWVLSIGLNISCGCFGSSNDNPVSWFTICRTLLFAVLSGVGYVLLRKVPPQVDS